MATPLNSKLITNNVHILEEPHAQIVVGLTDESVKNSSDGTLVAKKEIVVKRADGGNVTFSQGASEQIVSLPNSKTSFVPANSHLRCNFTCDDFWSYPRNGLAGLISRVTVSSGHSSVIESVDNYYRVCQKIRDVDFNSTYVNQHLLSLEGADWKHPASKTINFELTAAGSLVTITSGIAGEYPVGSILFLSARFMLVIAQIQAGDDLELTVEVLNGGAAIADAAATNGVVKYYPALDSERGSEPDAPDVLQISSVICSQFMGKALQWLGGDGGGKGAEMLHSFYGLGYLTGDEHRHLWLTQGLRLSIDFVVDNVGLYDTTASGATYQIQHMSYDYQELTYHPSMLAAVHRMKVEAALDDETPGPLLHFTTRTAAVLPVAADQTFDLKFERSRESVDSITMWRVPLNSDSKVDIDTTTHESQEYAEVQVQHAGGAYQLMRTPIKSMKGLWNMLYMSSEHNSSRVLDTMNYSEWSRRPYLVFNLQQYEVSDHYTGLKTNNNQEIQIMGKFKEVLPSSQRAVLMVAYRQRLIFSYSEDSGWQVEAVQQA